MEARAKRLHRKVAARFTWWDGLSLLAAAALGLAFLATGYVTPDGPYVVFWVLLACATALIGVRHILTSMRRPLADFAWCVLGGILGGAVFLFFAWRFVITHFFGSPDKDYGAMSLGFLYVGLLLLSPVAGFLTGFPVPLAIWAWFQSRSTGPKASEKQSE